MADFEVRIEFNDILKKLGIVESEAEAFVDGVALETQTRIVRNIQDRSPSSGPVTRYNPTRTAYPAEKDFPPNTDTGYLANSVQIEVVGPLTRRVLVGAEYGLPLELNGHPFVTPAAESMKTDLPVFIERMKRGIRR
ncbi:MAG: hypothetical protein MUF38_06410 [Anaerolineae bacterium]|nr:hypothetical protein [Anaerolineae bacterium]